MGLVAGYTRADQPWFWDTKRLCSNGGDPDMEEDSFSLK